MDDVLLLLKVQFRTYGQAQHAVAKVFRNRQIHNLFISRLPMQRDRIINHRGYALFLQVRFQRIAHRPAIALQRVLMKYV